MAGFGGSATNSFFAWGMRTSKPYAGLAAGREIQFTNDDWDEILRQVPEAAVVAPRLQMGGFRGGANVRRRGETGAFSVMGDLPEIFTIQSMILERGRLLNRIDVDDQRKVAVIGKRVVEVLFERGRGPDRPVGSRSTASGSRSSASSARARPATTAKRTCRRSTCRSRPSSRRSMPSTRCTGSRSPPPPGIRRRRSRRRCSASCARATRWTRGPARHRPLQPRGGVLEDDRPVQRHPGADVDHRPGDADRGRDRRLEHHADRRQGAHQGDRDPPRGRRHSLEGHPPDRARSGFPDLDLGPARPGRGRRR